MKTKGRMGWMPKPLLDEIVVIKKSEGINKDSKALKKMVEYSRKGREYKNLPIDYNMPLSRVFRRKR